MHPLAKFIKTTFHNALPHSCHKVRVPSEVVNRCQRGRQNLTHTKQVVQIRPGMTGAGGAGAARIQRRVIVTKPVGGGVNSELGVKMYGREPLESGGTGDDRVSQEGRHPVSDKGARE